ncbi:MAG TPA: methyltransferase domain-containing protein [Polyangiaceae bacterium]|jgi:ubiquinone/menaquinone biosynthesis C-methylase UbiE|nr:methyltransferase domain-containing protein [Polyangiaceae bacterium]
MQELAPETANRWKAQAYDANAACVSALGAGLIDLLGPLQGAEVLDLGCGTGDLAAQIAERGARVHGVDASAAMIEQAQRKYGADGRANRLSFEQKDGQSLDFDARFGHVFSNAALHWMPDADAVARGVARALRPGGTFVAEFGGQGCVVAARNALDTAMTEAGVSASQWLPNWYFPSIGEYAPVLERHGLRVESAWLFARPTPFAGPRGLRNWTEIFATRAVEQLGSEFEAVMARAEELARPQLWDGEAWVLDYVRIRLIARRASPLIAAWESGAQARAGDPGEFVAQVARLAR